MKLLALVAGAVLASTVSLSSPVRAADLGYELSYDDQDVYAQVSSKKRRHPNYYYNNSDFRPDEPVYANPPPGEQPDDYVADDQSNGNEEVLDAECLAKNVIRSRPKQQGWRSFHGLAMSPDVIGITASRPNGLEYRLKIDRCSGVIISSFLLDQPARRKRNYVGY